jgi:hypothetical protein
MVAYSFKPRFVEPIRLGLIPGVDRFEGWLLTWEPRQ